MKKKIPEKGEIISLDLKGDGSEMKFRVLRTDGTYARLLAMEDAGIVQFGESNVYKDSLLDRFMNKWYEGLSEEAKAAIQPLIIEQGFYEWHEDPSEIEEENPTYTYQCQWNWSDDYDNWDLAKSEVVGNRKVFALGLEDIYDYVGKRWITSEELNKLFWDAEGSLPKWVWLRSASADDSSFALGALANSGYVYYYSAYYSNGARPALCIDLSKLNK